MLEYPEIMTIADQGRRILVGKKVSKAEFLTPEKKFVFSANSPEEFSKRLKGQTIQTVQSCGNHLYIVMQSGYALNIGDTGGKVLYHESADTFPKKYDICVAFTDDTYLTHSVVMWGFLGAQTPGEMKKSIQGIKDEAREPVRNQVKVDDFVAFLKNWEEKTKVNAKKLIVSRKYFTGFGNGYAQDILWQAGIHPRRKAETFTEKEARSLFAAFIGVAEKAVAAGGRTIERNLLNEPGSYEPAMYRGTLGTPCSKCGAEIQKFPFEGGACYICPECQKI